MIYCIGLEFHHHEVVLKQACSRRVPVWMKHVLLDGNRFGGTFILARRPGSNLDCEIVHIVQNNVSCSQDNVGSNKRTIDNDSIVLVNGNIVGITMLWDVGASNNEVAVII